MQPFAISPRLILLLIGCSAATLFLFLGCCASAACRAMVHYTNYTTGFRLKVVDHALELDNHAGGWCFSVNPMCMHYWTKQENKLRATNKDCHTFWETNQSKLPRVEEEVVSSEKRLYCEYWAMSHRLIQSQAWAIPRSRNIPTSYFKGGTAFTSPKILEKLIFSLNHIFNFCNSFSIWFQKLWKICCISQGGK